MIVLLFFFFFFFSVKEHGVNNERSQSIQTTASRGSNTEPGTSVASDCFTLLLFSVKEHGVNNERS